VFIAVARPAIKCVASTPIGATRKWLCSTAETQHSAVGWPAPGAAIGWARFVDLSLDRSNSVTLLERGQLRKSLPRLSPSPKPASLPSPSGANSHVDACVYDKEITKPFSSVSWAITLFRKDT
jgi:hypothetical protein